jgi:hypothetical protein
MVAPIDFRLHQVRRFEQNLKLMDYVVHELQNGDAFIVFDAASGPMWPYIGLSEPIEPGLGAESKISRRLSWQPKRRFAQLCFHESWFGLDLPNTTITGTEAKVLVDEGKGFFWSADRADYRVSSYRQILRFNPVCKYYAYSCEREAAENLSHFFFDICGVPVDWEFLVKLGSFH